MTNRGRKPKFEEQRTPFTLVISSLQNGPKLPHEIVKHIRQDTLREYKKDVGYQQKPDKEIIKEMTPSIRTVHYILTSLKSQGIVKHQKNHKYSLTKRALNDPSVAGSIFAKFLQSRLMQDILSACPLHDISFCKPEDDIKKYLNESATILGAYIIYLFLQSLNPSGPVKTTAKRGTSSYARERDSNTVTWIKSSLPISQMLWEFRKWGGFPWYDDYYRGATKQPWFEIGKENFDQIMLQYQALYPELFNKLEEVRITAPERLQRHNKFIERVYKRRQT